MPRLLKVHWIPACAGMTIVEVQGCESVALLAVDLHQRFDASLFSEPSEERFRKAFDHVASGISLVTTDGHFLTVNAYLLKMLGYEEKEFLKKTLKKISNPGHFMAEMSSHKRLLNRNIESDIYEKLFIHKDGHEIWGLVSISLLTIKTISLFTT